MNTTTDNNEKDWWKPALFLFMRLSAWIVTPILLGLFVGKWLDKKFETAPWLFLISVTLAFAFSMVKIIFALKKYSKDQDSDVQI